MKSIRKVLRRLQTMSPSLRRYIVIGVTVYFLEIVIIVVVQYLGASNVLAVSISFWSGMITSFLLQKIITFEDRRRHYHIVLFQVLIYGLLVLFNFSFTVVVTYLLSGIVSAAISRTLALGITTMWNFYLYKTKIFTQGQQK